MDLLDEEDVEALRRIADRLRERSGVVGYGYFPGGDPRDFTPDPECCTGEELARHEHVCQLIEEGKVAAVDGRHHFPIELNGKVVGHVTHAAFGMGTYTLKDQAVDELANRLDEWLDDVRRAEEWYR
jgi:hypothetical protein